MGGGKMTPPPTKERELKMYAIQPNDRCFSTAHNGHNPFNTDGAERTTLSPELARTAFDFHILKKPSFDSEGRQIPCHFHLVRDDDDAFIPGASVGNQFTPVQHIDVFDYIVQNVMPAVPDLELEMAGTINGGGTTLIAAKFGNIFAIPGDDSPSELRLFINNPTNGSGRMTLGFTNVRVVCQNALLAATSQARQDGWRITHTTSAPELTKTAVKTIKYQAVAALEMKDRCERLARIGVDSETVARCLEAIYPAERLPEGPGRTRMLNMREAVIHQFEAGETAQTMKDKTSAWALFNSFTYPIFNPEKLEKRQDLAQVQYKATVGDNAKKVTRIFEVIESIAG